jgi:hypothetical protein
MQLANTSWALVNRRKGEEGPESRKKVQEMAAYRDDFRQRVDAGQALTKEQPATCLTSPSRRREALIHGLRPYP